MVTKKRPERSFKTNPVLPNQIKTHHILHPVHNTVVISPDDERIALTETMKKECEGKNIYFHEEYSILPKANFNKNYIKVDKEKLNHKKSSFAGGNYLKFSPSTNTTKENSTNRSDNYCKEIDQLASTNLYSSKF